MKESKYDKTGKREKFDLQSKVLEATEIVGPRSTNTNAHSNCQLSSETFKLIPSASPVFEFDFNLSNWTIRSL